MAGHLSDHEDGCQTIICSENDSLTPQLIQTGKRLSWRRSTRMRAREGRYY